MTPNSRPTPLTALLLAASCAAGCAGYPERTAAALSAFEAGRFEPAFAAFADPETTGGGFLQRAEAGTVALTAGDWERAQGEFHAATGAVEAIEERALVGPQQLGESLLAFTLNEGAAAYEGEGYERVQVHAALAMTYLAQGNLDGVFVEAKRANQLLEGEEQLYEKEYAAGGLGHFVSALAYELLEQYDQAYIDYQRMVDKGVGVELAGKALVRIASRLRYDDALPGLVERFGQDPERPPVAASVVVIAGLGLGPFKRATTLPVPTPDGILQWSVPAFQRRPQGVVGLTLRSYGAGAVETSAIEDVAKVSEENLNDRIGWLAARSAVRAIMKRELTQKLGREHGIGGQIVGDLFMLATERADLRAWLTLPDSWHAARLWVAPGEHELALEATGGEARVLGTFALEAGETMIVLARTLGGRVYAHPIGGLRIGPDPREQPVSGEATLAATETPIP